MSFFRSLALAPPDPIFGLQAAFNADSRKNKINLSIGVYKDADLKTPILKSVKEAEALLLEQEKSKEYLPIDGDAAYIRGAAELIFGPDLWSKIGAHCAGVQTVGGTGALRIGAEFLRREISNHVYISDPTWPNHKGVFEACGMKVATYPYYDRLNKCVNFDKLCAFLDGLEPSSIIVLHGVCHNPTGADLTMEQWKVLSALFLKRKLFAFFDFAYQGFGRGLDVDAAAIRLFIQEGHQMLVASSYSKNFSLYAERIGALFAHTHAETKEAVASHFKVIVRTLYSNPPAHGARIIANILSEKGLKKQWETELDQMRERADKMREALADALIAALQKPEMVYLKERVGLFSFCGLTKEQVQRLILEYGIYMTEDSRINVCGLNDANLNYVVDAIAQVTRDEKD